MKKQKQIKSKKAYLLVLVERKYGPMNQVLIEELTWIDLSDLKQLTTTLDPTYRNYNNWHTLLTAKIPTGIYTNLDLTGRVDKNDVPVLSADSKPELLLTVDDATLEEILTELARPKLTQFQKLFQ